MIVAISANTIYYHCRSLFAALIICCEGENNFTTANTRAVDVYSARINIDRVNKRTNVLVIEYHWVVPKLATIEWVTNRVSPTLCVYVPVALHIDVAGYEIILDSCGYLPIAHLITIQVKLRCLKLRTGLFNLYSNTCAPAISIARLVVYVKYQLVMPRTCRPQSS